MTQQQIKDLFTVNYGVKQPNKPRKSGKKHGLLFWLICLITVVPLVLIIVFKCINNAKWKKFDAEVARRAVEYPRLYDEHIKNYITNEQILAKALKKTGIDESQMGAQAGTHEPIYLDGQDWKRAKYYIYSEEFGTLADTQTYSTILFTNEQIVVYTLSHNFYKGDTHESTEEFFYKDITNIKTDDEDKEIPIGNEKVTVKKNYVALAAAGGKLEINVSSVSDYVDNAVKAMRALLRQKKF